MSRLGETIKIARTVREYGYSRHAERRAVRILRSKGYRRSRERVKLTNQAIALFLRECVKDPALAEIVRNGWLSEYLEELTSPPATTTITNRESDDERQR